MLAMLPRDGDDRPDLHEGRMTATHAPVGRYGRTHMVTPAFTTHPTPRASDLSQLASLNSPVISIYMNTHPFGRSSAQDGVRFAHLVNDARNRLLAAGHDKKWVKDFLEPLLVLSADAEFWQHQQSSLALFRSTDQLIGFRLTESHGETLAIGDVAVLSPLLPHVRDIPDFLLLALSKNDVRVYECDDVSARVVEDARIPTSFDDALRFEDPEAQLQFHSAGGGPIAHGHGVGDEVAKERLERFLMAVDRAVTSREGDPPRPLVLAAVEHNIARYRQLSAYPNMSSDHLAGNPDRTSVADLHQSAMLLLIDHAAAARASRIEDVRALVGTGRTETDPDAILDAARNGRIDTLWMNHTADDSQTTNDAVIATLRNGGRVEHSATPVLDGVGALAVTRW